MRPLSVLALLAGSVLRVSEASAGGPQGPEVAASEPAPATRSEPTALPWGKRRASLGVGAGVNISSSLTVVVPGVRAGYFVADGLELGVEVDVAALLWSAADLTEHPGLARSAPRLAVRVSPTLRYVFLRQPGFSPYLLAGVGPTLWNRGADGSVVAGHWFAAPGALIHLGKRIYLDLAIRFSSTFPGRGCRRAFTVASGEVPGYCGFQFGPRVGLTLAF